MLVKHESILFVFIVTTLISQLLECRPRRVTHSKPKRPQINTTITTQIEIVPNSSLSKQNKSDIRILSRGPNRSEGYVTDFSDQDIIFPDTYQIIFESSMKINGPPKCAEGTTFCENYTSYPNQKINEILKRQHVRKEFFGEDEAPEEKVVINNRIGEEEEFFCSSVQRTIFPKVGQTKNNKWKFIINQDDNNGYVQGVRVEMCIRENGPCNLITDLPNGYTTYCKQKHIYRRLLSVDEDGEPIPDSFLLPSACCCAYKRDVGVLSRIGLPVTPIKRIF